MTSPVKSFEKGVRELTRRFALIPNIVLRTAVSSERSEMALMEGDKIVARLVVHHVTQAPVRPEQQLLPGVSAKVPTTQPPVTQAPVAKAETDESSGHPHVELRATEELMRSLWKPAGVVLAPSEGRWVAWSRAEDYHTWRTVVPRAIAARIRREQPLLQERAIDLKAPLPSHVVVREDSVFCDGGRDAAPFYGVPGEVIDVAPVAITDLARMEWEFPVLCAIVRLGDPHGTWCAPLDHAHVTEDGGNSEDGGDFRLTCWQRVGDVQGDGQWVVLAEPDAKKPPKKSRAKKPAGTRRVWIRESAWDELDDATQAELTEPVKGSSIEWDGREGAITAVLPEGALLQSLAHLARSLDIELFFGERPPPVEEPEVKEPEPVGLYRDRAHNFDHLAMGKGACLVIRDTDGVRVEARPKKRTEAEWRQDIAQMLAGVTGPELLRLYSQKTRCLWDSRDGGKPEGVKVSKVYEFPRERASEGDGAVQAASAVGGDQ